jgi:hypothetical protein
MASDYGAYSKRYSLSLVMQRKVSIPSNLPDVLLSWKRSHHKDSTTQLLEVSRCPTQSPTLTMNLCHMSIYLLPSLEHLHAEPTYMGFARPASHVIAPINLLNRRGACRTISYVVLLLPFRKLIHAITASRCCFAGFSGVGSAMTCCAY